MTRKRHNRVKNKTIRKEPMKLSDYLNPFARKINSAALDPISNNAENITVPSSNALIYASELDFIARCIQDYPNIETGGQLYGSWTASGAPRVIFAIGPGPNANHQPAFFNQDVEYLEHIGARLKEYGLQHIGEWHSHHHLGLPYPSHHDAQTMQNGIKELNLTRFLLCIGSISDKGTRINPFNFAQNSHYSPAQWEIIPTRNRLREIIDNDLIDLLCRPSSTIYSFEEEYGPVESRPITDKTGWFSALENRQAFKQIVDMLNAANWVKEVKPQVSSDGVISLKVSTRTFIEVITFPKDFPNSSLVIERMGLIEETYSRYTFENEWTSFPDPYQSFKYNYENHLRNHI